MQKLWLITFMLFSLNLFSQDLSKIYIKNLYLNNIYTNDKNIESFINQYITHNERIPFKGYRIVIYFGTGRGALNQAKAIQSSFVKDHPEFKTYLVYEQPYFKVKIGNFQSKKTAYLFLQTIKPKYPKAFITEDIIDINNLNF